jgi:hypothetical protein
MEVPSTIMISDGHFGVNPPPYFTAFGDFEMGRCWLFAACGRCWIGTSDFDRVGMLADTMPREAIILHAAAPGRGRRC